MEREGPLAPLAGWLETIFTSFFEAYKDPEFAWRLAAWMTAVFLFIAVVGFLWAFVRHALALRPARKITGKALGPDRANVVKARIHFAKNFEHVDERLSKTGLGRNALSLAWIEFKESLFDTRIETRDGDVKAKQNSIRPIEFFSYAVHPPRFLGFFANLFVGVGLLLTFVGLVAALKQAGGDLGVTDGGASETNRALSNLISIAATKFITSIFGVGISILLKLQERFLTQLEVSGIEKLSSNLERGLKFVPPQSLADETLYEAREQTRSLKVMGETVAVHIGEKLDAAIAPLADSMAALKTSVEQGAQEQARTLREAAGTVVSDATGAELRALAQSLSGLGDVMNGLERKLQESGSVAAAQIGGAAEEMREALAGMPAALAAAAEASAKNFEQVNADAQRQLRDLLEDAARKFSTNNEQASAELARLVGELRNGLGALPNQMSEVSAAQARQLEEAGRNSGAAFSAMIEKAGNEFETATAGLRQGFSELPGRFLSATEQAAGRLNEASEATSERLRQAHEKFAETVAVVANLATVIETWRRGADDAVGQMRALIETSKNNQSAASELTRILDQRSKEATENLSSVASGIKNSADASASALAQAQQLHASITESHQALLLAWESHRARFESVDEDLARASKGLNDAAEQFAEKLRSQISAMDAGLSRNIGGLKDATEELSDVIQEIHERSLVERV